MEDIKQTLSQLLAEVSTDTSLGDDVRKDLVSLINEVLAEPTADNLEALSRTLEATADGAKFSAILETLASVNTTE